MGKTINLKNFFSVDKIGEGVDDAGNFISEGLGKIGSAFGGESPAERQERLLNNQFANVRNRDFQLGSLRGTEQHRGSLAAQQIGPSQFRGGQQALIGQLQNQFAGQGPGARQIMNYKS